MKTYVIIVAGGSGTRFGGPIPKQFLPLAGRPVLMHTIDAFTGFADEIIVVLPQAHHATWQQLCQQHDYSVPHRVVTGGDTRFHSVKNALDTITEAHPDALVAVHDGVRPLVSRELIGRVMHAAAQGGGAIPVVPVTDSIRHLDANGGSHPVVRSALRAVQTPQCFHLNALMQAYQFPTTNDVTDDAMQFELLGHSVALVDGDARNIKITGPADLAIAEMLMNNG
ncbi:MAG: 2-C-methyl-D-erythritol 4-phosphate cytidylyltransferase [Bacteroidales bacterium]|nr:2-C-methyl-D-erythritol 4-phosphate cytidylyltransferase [Bacteroidales bacterium]